MKLAVTFDVPSWQTSKAFEAFLRNKVKEFNFVRGRDAVHFHRSRRFTDAKYLEIAEKFYREPRQEKLMMRRWGRVYP